MLIDNFADYARKMNLKKKIQNNVLITSCLRLDLYMPDLTDKRLPNIKAFFRKIQATHVC